MSNLNGAPDIDEITAAGDDAPPASQPLGLAYFWLLLFFVIYCARPEDWIPYISAIPLARIAAGFCLLSFVASIPKLSSNLPRETIYLALLVMQLWLTVPMSPIWPGGAFWTTLDFSKVLLIILVMAAAVTSLTRLRRLIFIQTASVAAIAVVTLLKGTTFVGRLQGAVHGIYENSNELALILVLTLPFCLAFLLRASSLWKRVLWAAASGVMVYALLRTGSRSGMLALMVCGAVSLREFGLRGRKMAVLATAMGVGLVLILFAGDIVKDRFQDMFTEEPNTVEARAAHTSALAREQLFWKSVDVTIAHPVFGIGPGNFQTPFNYDQHNTYTEMSSEGGIPALILYLLLLGSALANLRKTNRFVEADSEEAFFAMALRASLYAFLVGSFFSASAYHFFPYFLVAYTSALVAIAESKASAESANTVTKEFLGDYAQPATVSFVR